MCDAMPAFAVTSEERATVEARPDHPSHIHQSPPQPNTLYGSRRDGPFFFLGGTFSFLFVASPSAGKKRTPDDYTYTFHEYTGTELEIGVHLLVLAGRRFFFYLSVCLYAGLVGR